MGKVRIRLAIFKRLNQSDGVFAHHGGSAGSDISDAPFPNSPWIKERKDPAWRADF